jgi:hypothetical protein
MVVCREMEVVDVHHPTDQLSDAIEFLLAI